MDCDNAEYALDALTWARSPRAAASFSWVVALLLLLALLLLPGSCWSGAAIVASFCSCLVVSSLFALLRTLPL